MKQKKFEGKLELNKETIVNLSSVRMKTVRGGFDNFVNDDDGEPSSELSACGTCGSCSCPDFC